MKVSTKVYCEGVWEGFKLFSLPPLRRGELIWIDFTDPKIAHVQGIFKINKHIHEYNAGRNGYSQRVWLEPQE